MRERTEFLQMLYAMIGRRILDGYEPAFVVHLDRITIEGIDDRGVVHCTVWPREGRA